MSLGPRGRLLTLASPVLAMPRHGCGPSPVLGSPPDCALSPVLAMPPAWLCAGLVELRGIEPLTSAVRLQRSPI